MSSNSSIALTNPPCEIDLLCGRNVLPKILQALRAAEECGEVCGINHQDVTSSSVVRRKPKQAVELRVACRSKWMRAIRIDRLPGEYLYCLSIVIRQRVVRQMRMKIERRN